MEREKHFSVIKPFQAETPVFRSIERVLKFFNFDLYPRIQRAAFVDIYEREEVAKCLNALQSNPALPVVCMDISGGKVLDHVLIKSPLLTQVVQFPNARMIDSLKFVEELPTLWDKPRFSFTQKQLDSINERIRSSIRHDLGHALRGSTYYDKGKLVNRGRKELGLVGSDHDIVQAIMAESLVIRPREYMQVNVVGVDWEGTVSQNGVLMYDRLTLIKSEVAQKNLPVMIWTGGDVNGVYRVFKQNGILDLDVVAKQDCAGLEIALAYDDEEKTELEKIYGVKIGEIKKIV